MLWIAAALLGIVATATVAWSASRLAGTRVGLAGAPLSVTSGLAPLSTPARPPGSQPPCGEQPGETAPAGSSGTGQPRPDEIGVERPGARAGDPDPGGPGRADGRDHPARFLDGFDHADHDGRAPDEAP